MPNQSITASAEPSFQPFSWLPEGDTKSTDALIACTMDIAYGIETILQIIEMDSLCKDNGETGIFQKYDLDKLHRLAITSARLLGDAADSEIYRINRKAAKA
ncbi:MAG: hypothetical protein NC112_09505 [Oxalobacter formigenes]|nr:hypothetical protein [Oxalobacter formigenes]